MPEPDNIKVSVVTREDLIKQGKITLKDGVVTITVNVYNDPKSGITDEAVDKHLKGVNASFSGKIKANWLWFIFFEWLNTVY